jgi:hypothetical protein
MLVALKNKKVCSGYKKVFPGYKKVFPGYKTEYLSDNLANSPVNAEAICAKMAHFGYFFAPQP